MLFRYGPDRVPDLEALRLKRRYLQKKGGCGRVSRVRANRGGRLRQLRWATRGAVHLQVLWWLKEALRPRRKKRANRKRLRRRRPRRHRRRSWV